MRSWSWHVRQGDHVHCALSYLTFEIQLRQITLGHSLMWPTSLRYLRYGSWWNVARALKSGPYDLVVPNFSNLLCLQSLSALVRVRVVYTVVQFPCTRGAIQIAWAVERSCSERRYTARVSRPIPCYRRQGRARRAIPVDTPSSLLR